MAKRSFFFLCITFSVIELCTLFLSPAPAMSSSVSDGYNLYNPLNSTTTYLMDNNGDILKTWTSSYRPANSVYLLTDGSLLRTANLGSSDFSLGGGRIEKFSWDGELTWYYDIESSDYLSHHDIEPMSNGNILVITWEKKTYAEAVAAGMNPALLSDGELWPDCIFEIRPVGDSEIELVWEWRAWDHMVQDYDASKSNYGVVADHPERINLNYSPSGSADIHHTNSIDYNEELDQIIISVRSFSEIWIIDHSTSSAEAAGSTGGNSGMGGDLLYRWGNPQTYDSGTSTDQQLFGQHDAKWIESGYPGADNILIFNNGQGRSDGDYSTVVEIAPPLNDDGSYTLGLPTSAEWTYTASPATSFYASFISGAMRLSNGNTLICDGPDSYVFEVTDAGETVWEYTVSDSNALFRFERYEQSYAGFDNTELDDEEDAPRTYTAPLPCWALLFLGIGVLCSAFRLRTRRKR